MNEPQAIEPEGIASEPQGMATTRLTRSVARAHRVQRRRLEKSVRWTVRERLRFMWFWFRLTLTDVRCVSGWIVDVPLPEYEPSYQGAYERRLGWYEEPFVFPWYFG